MLQKGSAPVASTDLSRAVDLLAGRRVVALTGAGLSTDSGIPDYRGPDSPPRSPMTYQEFVSGHAAQQRYWARSHVGWRTMGTAHPNAGHRAVAALERAGAVQAVITQNVDGLHEAAGSEHVVDLHGRISRVRCLHCDDVSGRALLDERLEALNPGFADDGFVEPGTGRRRRRERRERVPAGRLPGVRRRPAEAGRRVLRRERAPGARRALLRAWSRAPRRCWSPARR
ncbi:hypothetical protein GCM10025868_01570 [Angustibacter aerolatus]|uniref:protein acetyllysine N-acetyltransferase n=1 Tax=Angustibacter aerolatus TaxID=1162965 RepID=A0ABQ6JAV1_9ACTN|nr:Sir2 family NAD-dependent protein deacetylase [Angustibacter aerolatus]GMA84907.1 hypothetical protein GCM10025868_01570 [Angustibacter aerolatus]